MSKPHDPIPDELISAYLDGEVDSQQRAELEQLLDSDPRYQQMLEELRTLRETLQSLPRKQLDASFQQRVLRAAEQRSAATQVTTAPKSGARGRPRSVVPWIPSRPLLGGSRCGGRRSPDRVRPAGGQGQHRPCRAKRSCPECS